MLDAGACGCACATVLAKCLNIAALLKPHTHKQQQETQSKQREQPKKKEKGKKASLNLLTKNKQQRKKKRGTNNKKKEQQTRERNKRSDNELKTSPMAHKAMRRKMGEGMRDAYHMRQTWLMSLLVRRLV